MHYTDLCSLSQVIRSCSDTLSVQSPIGYSRDNNPIDGFIFGTGALSISLIAGSHADEPVGPKLLHKLVNYLNQLPPEHPLLTDYSWSIIPHANPDGQLINDQWWSNSTDTAELISYLSLSQRELPGEDIEFGYPRDARDPGARIENREIYDWWISQEKSFDLHASLHGMAFAAGPWYLIESEWQHRISFLKEQCLTEVEAKAYSVHDIERLGEKGFFRLGKGFCTRPDSENMRAFFMDKGDVATADRFHPSSMEVMRSISKDCLTVVSEMPLFITPGIGDTLGPPDPIGAKWKEHILKWRTGLMSNESILDDSYQQGLSAMSIDDQMHFQWHLIATCIEQIRLNNQ
ncbi:MAG: M14 family zinc carboxypeptidase [Fibrobacterales bacterium]